MQQMNLKGKDHSLRFYRYGLTIQYRGCFDIAREVFDEAVKHFSSELSDDSYKFSTVESAKSLKGVYDTVINAKDRYEASRLKGGAYKWLSRLAPKIRFYGNIMDVLMQHHPEYVALAWGAMKFMLVVRCANTLKRRASADNLLGFY